MDRFNYDVHSFPKRFGFCRNWMEQKSGQLSVQLFENGKWSEWDLKLFSIVWQTSYHILYNTITSKLALTFWLSKKLAYYFCLVTNNRAYTCWLSQQPSLFVFDCHKQPSFFFLMSKTSLPRLFDCHKQASLDFLIVTKTYRFLFDCHKQASFYYLIVTNKLAYFSSTVTNELVFLFDFITNKLAYSSYIHINLTANWKWTQNNA